MQELARDYGANRDRFDKEADFCIQCGLCVRREQVARVVADASADAPLDGAPVDAARDVTANDASVGADADEGACATPLALGAAFKATDDNGAMPPFTGGTIADGTYEAFASTNYIGS